MSKEAIPCRFSANGFAGKGQTAMWCFYARENTDQTVDLQEEAAGSMPAVWTQKVEIPETEPVPDKRTMTQQEFVDFIRSLPPGSILTNRGPD